VEWMLVPKDEAVDDDEMKNDEEEVPPSLCMETLRHMCPWGLQPFP